MSCKVTAIIPAYNAEKYIEQAILSVLRQTVECKVIVVNDASTDNTHKIVKKYCDMCSEKVVAINKEKNEGVCAARNDAILMADTEYIAFLDADDWWSEEKLEKQLKAMQEFDAVGCYTGRELMSSDGASMGKIISVPKDVDYKELLKGNVIPCSSVLLRRDEAIQYPMVHDELHEDYIMWLSMLRDGKKFIGINEPMLKSRMAEGGKSRNKWKSAIMTFRVYRYMKIPVLKLFYYFFCYTYNGIRKYN